MDSNTELVDKAYKTFINKSFTELEDKAYQTLKGMAILINADMTLSLIHISEPTRPY